MSDRNDPSLRPPAATPGRPDPGARPPTPPWATVHESWTGVTIAVPDMVDRSDLRTVTARIRDVPGVVAVEARLAVRRIHVEGLVSRAEVRAAVLAAGYTVTDDIC